MNRADFWCRILAWAQIGGALAVAATIYAAWALIFGWITIEDGGAVFAIFKWFFIIVFALPPFLAGALTYVFAGRVEQAQAGRRDESAVLLRVCMALAGLWSAGVIGFVGISVPHIGFFAVLGLATAVIAIMGQDWTADLFAGPGRPA